MRPKQCVTAVPVEAFGKGWGTGLESVELLPSCSSGMLTWICLALFAPASLASLFLLHQEVCMLEDALASTRR